MDGENDVMYKLGRLETLSQSINEKLDQYIKDNKATLVDHETRIKDLEQNNVRINTWAGAIAAVASVIVTFIMRFVHFG